MYIRTVHKNGHLEVYIDGEFYCSADNYDEAFEEISKIFSEE